MMKTIVYDIYDFKWFKEENTFRANSETLYDISSPNYYKTPFPNGRKKFNITNEKTKGFRRFIYQSEILLNDKEILMVYKSEDGIKCEIVTKIE
jgi:hypothetical protein